MILKSEASQNWRSALDVRMVGQEEGKDVKKAAALILIMVIVCVCLRQARAHQYF